MPEQPQSQPGPLPVSTDAPAEESSAEIVVEKTKDGYKARGRWYSFGGIAIIITFALIALMVSAAKTGIVSLLLTVLTSHK